MPFNGSGTYSPPSPPNFPAISGAVITAAYYNTVINDIAAGLSLCLTRDGQSGPSGAINWNSQNLTGVASFGAVNGAFSGTLAVTGATTLTGAVTASSTVAVAGALTRAGNTVWDAGNDGAGSGLDADLLDGQQGAYYSNIPARLGYTPVNLAGDTMTGALVMSYPQARVFATSSDVSVSGTNFSGFEIGDVGALRGYFRSYRDGSGMTRVGYNSFLSFAVDAGGAQTETMRIDTSNGLRLGITTPVATENLTVAANQNSLSGAVLRNTNAGSSAYSGIFLNASGNSWGMRMGSGAANSNTLAFTVDIFGTPTDRMTITTAGVVNIPGSLTIAGNAVATQAFVTASYAPLASPALTGVPTAPTAAGGTNTTQIATTAYVVASFAPLASPALTGTPTSGGIEIGYRNIPRVTGGLDAGKCNAVSAGFTINTGAAAGSTYSIYNDSAAAITITQGAGLTLRLGGTTTTGDRTIAARGFATVWFNSTTEAIMQGSGVT